jgi:DNA primase
MKLIDCAVSVREALDIETVMERYGITFNNRGYAKCPFHSEDTASFRAKNRTTWHCFGCGKTGDAIDFVIEYFGLKWSDALVKLNDDFSLNLPIGRRQTLSESLQASRRRHEMEQERAIKAAEVEAYETLLDTYAAFDRAAMLHKHKTDPILYRPVSV